MSFHACALAPGVRSRKAGCRVGRTGPIQAPMLSVFQVPRIRVIPWFVANRAWVGTFPSVTSSLGATSSIWRWRNGAQRGSSSGGGLSGPKDLGVPAFLGNDVSVGDHTTGVTQPRSRLPLFRVRARHSPKGSACRCD